MPRGRRAAYPSLRWVPDAMPDRTDFDALYRCDPDPFRVRSRWYEQRKQAVLLASLARRRYDSGWDLASGTGHLSGELAQRCATLLATDGSERAVELTAELTAHQPNVRARTHRLPLPPPDGPRAEPPQFDLVVAAEVVYYLSEPDRWETYRLVERVARRDRAEVVTVHWRHLPHDAFLSGAAVTDEMGTAMAQRGWRQAVRHDDVDFVLASWFRGATCGAEA